MNYNQWAFDLETKIYSLIKARTYTNLKKIYPKIFFTNTDRSSTEPQFPTVYIHELPTGETNTDLENDRINSVIETIQVDVTTNENKNDAKKVLAEITNEFKKMSFTIISMPTFDNDKTIYRATARFRKVINATDKF